MKLSARDLYCLRHTHLATQRAALKAQQAEQTFRELLLEMEHRYGLLGTNASIDVHTGEVQASPDDGKGVGGEQGKEDSRGFVADEDPSPSGPSR